MTIVEHSQTTITFTIADGSTASGPVQLAGQTLLGLIIPALNGAPTLNVEVSHDGVSWFDLLQTNGTSQAIAITGGATPLAVGLDDLTRISCFAYFRLVASVAQTAERTFLAVCKG